MIKMAILRLDKFREQKLREQEHLKMFEENVEVPILKGREQEVLQCLYENREKGRRVCVDL